MKVKKTIPILIVLVFAGCATPTYVANWNHLRVGMTRDEVKSLFGEPRSMTNPGGRDKPPSDSDVEALAKASPEMQEFASAFFLELWSYGKTSTLFPSPRAFVVFFGPDGKVLRYRRPVEGRHVKTDSQSPPRD